jgi:hypothetical protein
VRKFVLLLGCFAASPLAAGEAALTGENIKTMLGGSLIAIDTPVGSTVSVRIGHDGMMAGEAGTALGAVLGSSKDRGRWRVVQDQVCFKWFRWFDAEEKCATISIDGNHLSWRRPDGDTGTGTIIESGKPISKPAVVVADAPKKVDVPAHKPEEKKPKPVEVATSPKAPATHEAIAPEHLPVVALAPVSQPKPKPAPKIAVALNVPAPQPALRPKHLEKISVASVKPQFFTPPKLHTAKVETVRAQAPKAQRRPFRVAGVDPSDVLNIRTGPSSDYQSVGSIAPDSRGITITGPCANDWCPVKHRTLVGWVNRRYLTEETAANTAAVTEEQTYWPPTP